MGNKGNECDEFEEVTGEIMNSEIGGLLFRVIIHFFRTYEVFLLLLLLSSRYRSKPSN